MKYIFTFIILSTIFQLTAFSQSRKTTSDWGEMDEIWSRLLGNCMMCTFRCVKDGKVVFYEFLVIEQNVNDSVPVLKLRHFYPGSIGWRIRKIHTYIPLHF